MSHESHVRRFMEKTFLRVIVIVCATLCASAFAQEPVLVPELTTAPTVDGVKDSGYENGARLVDFWNFARSVGQARPATKDTQVWLGHADKNLYVFCEASEPRTNLIKTDVTINDGSVWTDDSFELFLDIGGQRKEYFQFILSANGTTADFFKSQKAWSAEYESAAKIWNGSWTAEWAIPFKAFGITSVDDINAQKVWTFNVCRNDIVGDEVTTWVPANSSAVTTLCTPALFAEMRIVPNGKPQTFSLRGAPLRPLKALKEQLAWNTTDPLYEELLTNKPRRTPGHVGFYWTHPMASSLLRSMAVQYGLDYSLEETGSVFKEVGFHPLQTGDTIERWKQDPSAERYPSPGAMYATNFKYARGQGMPSVESSGLTILFAPLNRARYLEQAEAVLRGSSDEIWGVFTGDEIAHYQTYGLIRTVSELASLHPYAQELDKDIRERFGCGKYGAPRSKEDLEPYRWLAVDQWIDDQICLLTEDLRKVVDRVAPKMILVSDDPEAGFHGHDYARRGKWCDVVTHQTYPSRNPLRQEVGFITKMLYDLSGKSAWPCVHAENYGASYSPGEAAEVYSQVFRCGGDGIHYYPDDVQGGRRNVLDTHYCRIGAPDRWATMYSIFKRIQSLPCLKVPRKTKTAIFIEPSSFQATIPSKRGQHLEYEMCFSFLGPHARSWFQFIHAGQVQRKEVKLSSYKTVFVPMAKFFSPDRAQELIDYCKSGGLVVCGDPEAFRYSTKEAYQPVPAQQTLAWKCAEKPVNQSSIKILDNDFWPTIPKDSSISFAAPVASYQPDSESSGDTLASFENGDPAIVRRKIGKGSWIQFAFQPFDEDILANESMRSLFKGILKRQGEKTDLDIWRFTFPAAPSPNAPEGQCLTGNACVWELNVPSYVGGPGVPFKVCWSAPPQGVTATTMSSSECKLFDRHKSLAAQDDRKLSDALKNWAYTWELEKSSTIDFEFENKQKFDRIQLWFSGTLPTIDVLIQTGPDKWSKATTSKGKNVGEDVASVTVPLGNVEAGSVRLALESVANSSSFSLCEVEIWGPGK